MTIVKSLKDHIKKQVSKLRPSTPDSSTKNPASRTPERPKSVIEQQAERWENEGGQTAR